MLNGSRIARLYHSAAALMPDGRILVGRSNPHPVYNFTRVTYPTELSLEAFYPPYLDPQYTNLRPSILTVELADTTVSYAEMFSVTFVCSAYRQELGVSVTVIAPSFTTHSFGMNRRMVPQMQEVGFLVAAVTSMLNFITELTKLSFSNQVWIGTSML